MKKVPHFFIFHLKEWSSVIIYIYGSFYKNFLIYCIFNLHKLSLDCFCNDCAKYIFFLIDSPYWACLSTLLAGPGYWPTLLSLLITQDLTPSRHVNISHVYSFSVSIIRETERDREKQREKKQKVTIKVRNLWKTWAMHAYLT